MQEVRNNAPCRDQNAKVRDRRTAITASHSALLGLCQAGVLDSWLSSLLVGMAIPGLISKYSSSEKKWYTHTYEHTAYIHLYMRTSHIWNIMYTMCYMQRTNSLTGVYQDHSWALNTKTLLGWLISVLCVWVPPRFRERLAWGLSS